MNMDNTNITLEDIKDARYRLKVANSLAVFGGREFMDALDLAILVMDVTIQNAENSHN